MNNHHGIKRFPTRAPSAARRAALVTGALSLAIAGTLLGSVGAAQADPPATIGSCTFVAAPTPADHTVCENTDLSLSVGMVGGLDLDYADLEGSDLTDSPLLVAASSTKDIDLARANLTDTSDEGVNFSGGSLKGATLDGASMQEANLSGLDLRATSTSSSTDLQNADLSNTNLTDVTFDAGTYTGGVNWQGANLTGATLPTYLDGGDFAGDNLGSLAQVRTGTTMNGDDFTGASFNGLTLDGFAAPGAELLQSSFVGVTFTPGSTFYAAGANFTQADFHGVDFSVLGSINVGGAPFAWADLAGATFPITGGGYYGDADFEGATLYGNGSGAVFHRANLKNAVIGSSSNTVNLNGAQFNGADLTGANLDYTTLEGTIFDNSNLTGANIQATGLLGISGVVIVDSNLTDTTFPPASNGEGPFPGKWVYGMFIQDDTLTGSSLVNSDVTATATAGATSLPVTIPLPVAFANADGEVPYGSSYDGNYWWGSHYECDHTTGDTFPVGVTTVNCKLLFDDDTDTNPTPELDLSTAVPVESVSDPYDGGVIINGLEAPATPAIAKATPRSDFGGGSGDFDVDGYKYTSVYVPAPDGVDTVSTSSFTVTVDAPPTLTGSADNAVAGTAYPADQLTITGFPNPTVAVKSGSLPAGMQLTAGGVLDGTPAAGTAGTYSLVAEATNGAGAAADLPLTFSVVDPAVKVKHAAKIVPGDSIPVTGTGFTPGGHVQVWLQSPTQLVKTVTADVNGDVATTITAPQPGTHHVELVDVASTQTATSKSFTVVLGVKVLGYTGTDITLTVAGILLAVLAGSALAAPSWIRSRRRPGAAAPVSGASQ